MGFARALPLVLAGETAHKGLSAFLYTGLSRFLYGFRDLFAGLSAFFCVSPFAWLARWLAGSLLWVVTVVITAIIVTLVTIQAQ